MKTLYLECAMGAAGDMLLAALLELVPDADAILHTLEQLPGIHVTTQKVQRCGITGTKVTVTVHGEEEGCHDHHHHHHTTLKEIHAAIDALTVSQWAKDNAKAVYGRLAQAESRVHGQPVEEVHFHEVGAWDAVADVTGVCLAMEQLAPEQIIVSPVHVGYGHVKCAHGLLPVPAPATALLLEGVPVYGEVKGELCTPTGAALLTHFAHRFATMPTMKTEKIGCGCGTKEFERANCLRAFWGSTEDQAEQIMELSCNLDDMTPEAIGFATEELLANGALDVYTTAIGMKKSRPGIMLTCLCRPQDELKMTELFFRHTTTLGLRKVAIERHTLSRSFSEKETPYGTIRMKHAEGWGIHRSKPEYEDVAKAARTHNIPLSEILDCLK